MIPIELQRTLRWLIPLVFAIAAVVVKLVLGTELATLVLAGAVLVGVIFLLWGSVQALTGETELTIEEAISLAAPSVEEEQKRAVLRTLKDLEYERSVGKISDEDYRQLVGIYRERAKRLIQAVDEETLESRERAERLVEKRLKAAQLEPRISAKPADRSDEDNGHEDDRASTHASVVERDEQAVQQAVDEELELDDQATGSDREPSANEPAAREEQGQSLVCAECDTTNDADARFCKHCGTDLEEAS